MVYKKRFDYKDEAGKEDFINLRPLPVTHLPKLLKIAGRFTPKDNSKELSQGDVGSILGDEDITNSLVDVCIATITKSCPEMKEDEIDEFVSRHFLGLFQAILDFNLDNKGAVKK